MSGAIPNLANWSPPADLLHDRSILVTGAANGIGRSLATALAAHGANTILLDRDVKGLERTSDQITAAGNAEPGLAPMDLTGATANDYRALAVTIAREYRRLDGLVHNAAMLGALVPLAHFEDDLWLQALQVNLNAPCQLTLACLHLLEKSPDASIVFTADAVGRRGRAYWGAYGVAKAGLEGFMQILADELEANTTVRVNSLDPGPVLTGLRRLAYPGEDAATLNSPEDVVKPFLYLLGPDSRGITGQQFSLTAMM
ncbi:MAG: YciK family oxidoreductase [Gammaproteobacteria bacterium]|jgi:NAD(P)-dependent dehydrogenase (short-subunit alcohol dehydrogenase family)